MSDETVIKILRHELAELRAECERWKTLQKETEERRDEVWRELIRKTNADNNRLLADHGVLTSNCALWKARAEKAEADNVALREGLASILPRFTAPESAWESACNDEALNIARRLAPLLASPDPKIVDDLATALRERDKLLAVVDGNNANLKRVMAERDAAMRVALAIVDTWQHPAGLKCDCKPCKYTRELRATHPHLFERKGGPRC